MYLIIVTNEYIYLPCVMFVMFFHIRKCCISVSISSEKNSHSSDSHDIHDINSVLIIPHLHDVNGDETDGQVRCDFAERDTQGVYPRDMLLIEMLEARFEIKLFLDQFLAF